MFSNTQPGGGVVPANIPHPMTRGHDLAAPPSLLLQFVVPGIAAAASTGATSAVVGDLLVCCCDATWDETEVVSYPAGGPALTSCH